MIQETHVFRFLKSTNRAFWASLKSKRMENRTSVTFLYSKTQKCSHCFVAKYKVSTYYHFWTSIWTEINIQLRNNFIYRHATVDPNKVRKIKVVKITEYGTATHILRAYRVWASCFWEMGFSTGIIHILTWRKHSWGLQKIRKW